MRTEYVDPGSEDQDFSKVVVKGPRYNRKPYCREHGALNKVYVDEEKAFWQCQAITERGDGHLEIVETCDAACKEIEVEDPVGFELDAEYPEPKIPPEITARTSGYRTGDDAEDDDEEGDD
ncbi:hypothetical protein [Natrinema salinisoli]|uniref:hypothetical protein n=1 Tax=Natrinema salinisoli TaxID=2878535 RepID=UPI001CF0626B|nr:hypothetical protein [Natrinema salinisoli]